MDSGPKLKHKVTVKFNHIKASTPARPPSRSNLENIPSRPASPAKSYVTTSSAVDSQAFRPKAKVNSSATTRKAAAVKSPTIVTTNIPSRPGSPSKLTPRIRNGVTSPTTSSSNRSPVLRSPPAVSAPVTPEVRNRPIATNSAASSSIGPLDDTRSRTGSVSLHHAVSFSTFPKPSPMGLSVSERLGTASASSSPRLKPSGSLVSVPDRAMTNSPSLRIRSKVTAVAKPSEATSPPTPTTFGPSPSLPAGRSQTVRARTASISSNLSQQLAGQPGSPPSQFYPITTASPAANPHRFQSSRPPPARTSPPSVNHIFQSFSQQSSKVKRDESPSPGVRVPKARVISAQAKVDPASIPLPPLSPPASSVSFSSRSSASRSSVSVVDPKRPASQASTSSTASSRLSPASTQQQNGNMDHLKSTLDNLVNYTTGQPSGDDDTGSDGDQADGDEHKVKATAKSNRKIADLEITNRSLLAINATLEATKHRQAKEIRELKRKLRESRLILPPTTYRAVKSSLGPSEIADDEEDEDDGDDSQDDEPEKDEIYQRIKATIDNLVKSGQRALEKEVKDFPEGAKGTAKVLTAEEVRDWHQSSVGDEPDKRDVRPQHVRNNLHDNNDSSYASMHQYDTDDLDISFDQSFQSMTSEDEVESMTIFPGSAPSSPPPIFITKPS